MANQRLGEFAGAFTDALTKTLGDAQDRKARDEIAKQRAKFVDLQMRDLEGKIKADTTMSDILLGTVEEFVPAEPIQTPGGREIPQFSNASREPQNLIEALTTNPEFQAAAVQSGKLGVGDFLDFQTAQDQLAARPDINGLFGRVDSAGNHMLIPEGITLDPVRGPIQTFGINPEFNTEQDEAFSELSFTQLVSDISEVADIEGVLAETFSESGFPLAEQATAGKLIVGKVAGSLGLGDIERGNKADAAKRERARKLYGLILNRRLNKLMETDPNLSITQIQQQMEISPSVDKPGSANILLLADFLQEELMNADIEGTSMSAADRKASLDFIRKARGGGFSNAPSPVIVDVPAILKATREELDAMDIENMTGEMLDAFEKRRKEIK